MLIEAALIDFGKRGQLSIYRSMLRSAVVKLDLIKRTFKDKDEWKSVLSSLEQAGKLTYFLATDTVQLPLPAE